MAKLEFRGKGLCGCHRSEVVGRHDESGDQHDSPGQRQHVTGSASLESAVFLHLDHVMHWTKIGSYGQCATRLRNGSAAAALPSVLSEEQREARRDDTESLSVSAGHERRSQQSGDDGTGDQGVRETRKHRHSSRLAS